MGIFQLSLPLLALNPAIAVSSECKKKIIDMSTKTIPYIPYKVKDMTLAEWGRKEITLAEAEMPGLMALGRNMQRSNRLREHALQAVFT